MRNSAAFFSLGLANNVVWVTLNAGAKNIANGGVGLEYVCNIVPALIVKVVGPHVFHLFSYESRVIAMILLAFWSQMIVGFSDSMGWQLFGVCLCSLQSGLGESSFLGLTHHFPDPKIVITAWSSGTGLAGMFGYIWVIFLSRVCQVSFKYICIISGVIFPLLTFVSYFMVLEKPFSSDAVININQRRQIHGSSNKRKSYGVLFDRRINDFFGVIGISLSNNNVRNTASEPLHHGGTNDESEVELEENHIRNTQEKYNNCPSPIHFDENDTSQSINLMEHDEQSALENSFQDNHNSNSNVTHNNENGLHDSLADGLHSVPLRERYALIKDLAVYMVPLLVVYFAEYSIQAGPWAAMGFPVTSKEARDSFYLYSNLMYQVGVFISRSSGYVIQLGTESLYIMAAMQVSLLIFLVWDAVSMVWYNYWLLLPCFVVGILGGGVYVNAFNLISKHTHQKQREFALSFSSCADTFGILLADITALFIQACIYKAHGINGAYVQCPA